MIDLYCCRASTATCRATGTHVRPCRGWVCLLLIPSLVCVQPGKEQPARDRWYVECRHGGPSDLRRATTMQRVISSCCCSCCSGAQLLPVWHSSRHQQHTQPADNSKRRDWKYEVHSRALQNRDANQIANCPARERNPANHGEEQTQ